MDRREKITLFFLLIVCLALGSYKLTESPPTWFDEGMITQLALNLSRHGIIGLQTAPDNFTSGAYISVGFPLIFPLAGVFKIFGEGVLQARLLMLTWLIFLVILFYLYVLKEFGLRAGFMSGLMLVTFAPLYGNGKSVLGEVPGLCFFFLFLILLRRLEKSNFNDQRLLFLSGLVFGISVFAKPIFLLVAGSLAVVYCLSWFQRRKTIISYGAFFMFAIGTAIPLIVWVLTQFSLSDSFWDVAAFYRNPYQLTNISSLVAANLSRFFKEISPLYTIIVFGFWSVYLASREFEKRGSVNMSEKTAYIFSLLVLFFYLRTPGWYRYFFPAQIVSLAYFSSSLLYLAQRIFKKTESKKIVLASTLAIAMLVSFQMYQVCCDSWVAGYYNSTRTKELKTYFSKLDPQKNVLVYNAPEVVIFLPRDIAYYQFLEINKGRTIGSIAFQKDVDTVISLIDESGRYSADLFPDYKIKDVVNRYVVLEPVLNKKK